MKAPKLLCAILVFIPFISGCQKDEELKITGQDYLIFGHFYGECEGETCIEIFKLEGNKLLEDTNDNYPQQATYYNGKFIEHPDSKFNLVKDLPAHLPSDLLKSNQKVIGQPDAGDWGGLYIEYSRNETRQYWLIDQEKSNIPDYLHDFVDKVNERIEWINE